MNLAVTRLDNQPDAKSSLPWMSEESYSRLVFIDGKRGTGKTTLMLSLVTLLDNESADEGFENVGAGNVLKTAQSLRERVVVLEPLDMEPMPKGTPILSAILARLKYAANTFGERTVRQRGLLDGDLHHEQELARFSQLQACIARALDGNLEDRQGGLDREQFGQEVLTQEDDRLLMRYRLAESLESLSQTLPGGKTTHSSIGRGQQKLFLVLIDDVDLNPKRCLELLRLLRHYSVPQLFFVLMGQYDLVESIAKLKVSSEFGSVANTAYSLSAVAPQELRKKLRQAATANLQKQIPRIVHLPHIELNNVFEFAPVLGTVAGDPNNSNKLPTLGRLLEKVLITDSSLPAGDLKELLTMGRCGAVNPARTADDLKRGEYPGLGAFEVTPRQLTDLWRALSEQFRSDITHIRPLNDRLLMVFTDYWNRIIDDDPNFDRGTRERIRREGINAFEVIADNTPFPYTEHIISDVDSTVSTSSGVVSYSPQLRVKLPVPGSGVPRLRIRGTAIEVAERRTRCAFVLLHDLQWLLSDSGSDRTMSHPVTVASPVSVSWISDEQEISWPIPPLTTFARLTEFLNLKSLAALTKSPDSSTREVTSSDVTKLLSEWISVGTNLLAGISADGELPTNWGDLIQSLRNVVDEIESSPSQRRQWLLDVVLLLMPEACGLELATKQVQGDLPEELQSAVSYFERLLAGYRPELIARREEQLEPLWRRHPNLWEHLNEQSRRDSWINLRIDEPPTATIKELQGDIGRLKRHMDQQALLSRLETLTSESTIEQDDERSSFRDRSDKTREPESFAIELARVAGDIVDSAAIDSDFAESAAGALLRSAESLENTAGSAASVSLHQQLVKLEQTRTAVDASRKQRENLANAYYRLAGSYWEAGRLEEAEETARKDLEISRRLAEQLPDNPEAQHDLSVSYLRLGDLDRVRGRYSAAEEAFDRCLAVSRRLAEDAPGNREEQFGLGVIYNRLGLVYQDTDRLQDAENAFERYRGISRQLTETATDDRRAQREFSVSLDRLGELYLLTGRYDNAAQSFAESRRIFQQLAAADTDNRHAQLDLSTAGMLQGQLHLATDQIRDAGIVFEQSLETVLPLAVNAPNDRQVRRQLSLIYKYIGHAYLVNHRLDKAEEEFNRSINITQQLSRIASGDIQLQYELAMGHCDLAEVFVISGRDREAEELFSAAARMIQDVLRATSGGYSRERLAQAIINWGLSRTTDDTSRSEQLAAAARTVISQERDKGNCFTWQALQTEQQMQQALDMDGSKDSSTKKPASKKGKARRTRKKKR